MSHKPSVNHWLPCTKHWSPVTGHWVSLHAERLAAAAGRVHVRIHELEGLLEPVLDEVESRAVDDLQALRIHDHLRSVRLELAVVRANFVRVVVGVLESGATHFLHAHAQADAAPALRELRPYLLCRTFRQLYRHTFLTRHWSLKSDRHRGHASQARYDRL